MALGRLLGVTRAAIEERSHYRRALESRIVIEQAKGMLAERLQLSVDEAFAVLRSSARAHGVNLHELAQRVVTEPLTPAEVLSALQTRLERDGRG